MATMDLIRTRQIAQNSTTSRARKARLDRCLGLNHRHDLVECPHHWVSSVIAKINGMPPFSCKLEEPFASVTPLVECPQHFVPIVFSKNDGMRPSFRLP